MSFGDVLWSMLIFFFWMMAIWMFISIFADILRRNDVSGWGKATWIILLFIVPFFGALIYIIVRPKMTEQDKEILAQVQERQRREAGYSSADEIAKLSALRDKGDITPEQFEELKTRALATA